MDLGDEKQVRRRRWVGAEPGAEEDDDVEMGPGWIWPDKENKGRAEEMGGGGAWAEEDDDVKTGSRSGSDSN